MPSIRNPLHMPNIIEHIADAVDKAKFKHRNVSAAIAAPDFEVRYVDLRIQFIGASGLPNMDVGGSADPYFVAELDKQISFVSTVQADTLTPVWNEWWFVRNVPAGATLAVRVLDKDDDTVTDDYIGRFATSVAPGVKEAEIESPVLRRTRGTMWLKIESAPAVARDAPTHAYAFDGPVRFSRHSSPIVGRLTGADTRLYSTWKVFLRGVPRFFGARVQPWNHGYAAAQRIFEGPAAHAVRAGIEAGHRLLYARSTTNEFGVLDTAADVLHLLHGDASTAHAQRVKPAVYSYILSADDDSFRFSETGAAFFIDCVSKHALHSNCARAVRYSGEFHPRPAGGWAAFAEGAADADARWELVVDNNSGTYAPDAAVLPALQGLLELNFPGIGVCALAREDPELVSSREACRAHAARHCRVQQDEPAAA